MVVNFLKLLNLKQLQNGKQNINISKKKSNKNYKN